MSTMESHPNLRELKTNFYIQTDDIPLTVNQTVIIPERFMNSLVGSDPVVETRRPSLHHKWYPLANSFYPFTEDVDPLERTQHLVVSEPKTFAGSDMKPEDFSYSEKEAQRKYLESNPVSFVIFGKPEIGERELAKSLAEYWNCVYVDPEVLITEEIRNNSKVGQCLDFNLKCGRSIDVDIIMKLIENRVNSETAKHRGFVICGLPLIPNGPYEEDPFTSSFALSTAKEVLDEVINGCLEQIIDPMMQYLIAAEDDPGEGFPIISEPFFIKIPETLLEYEATEDFDIEHEPNVKLTYQQQLDFVFKLLKEPFLIVYVACNSPEVVNKRKNQRINIYSKGSVDLMQAEHEENSSLFDLRHLMLVPNNFPAKVRNQLDWYHKGAFNFLEKRILNHDPDYFVKVDGRCFISAMFEMVKAKLETLPLQKVAVPTRINYVEDLWPGEDQALPVTNKKPNLKDAFKVLRTKDVVTKRFKWIWSEWGETCPVSMKEGVYQTGSPDYAVHFMNRIFFLHDESAFIKFYRNPRPFLLPPYPRSRCRILLIGPPKSGKTAISRILSYVYDATILKLDNIVQELVTSYIHDKETLWSKEATTEGLRLLLLEKEKEAAALELERVQNIKDWVSKVSDKLQSLKLLLDEKEESGLVFSSFPMAMQKKPVEDLESEDMVKVVEVREELEALNVSNLQDVEIQDLLADKRKLLHYLPAEFRKKPPPPPASEDDPFVVAHVKATLKQKRSEFHLSSRLLNDGFLKTVEDIEDAYLAEGHGNGGWIITGISKTKGFLDKLILRHGVDDIIALKDSSEGNEFLKERYKRNETVEMNYRDFLAGIGQTEASLRAPETISTHSFHGRIVKSIIDEIIDTKLPIEEDPSVKIDELLQKFSSKYRDVQKYLTKHGLQPIKIDIANKPIEQVVIEVLRSLDRYKLFARPFTNEDRAEEIQTFGIQTSKSQGGEDTIHEGLIPTTAEKVDEYRQYGDTYHYCPVTLFNDFVLWKGKDNFTAIFRDNIYLLSSKEAMEEFLLNPGKFLSNKCPKTFPPPRICVAGRSSTKKSILASRIANNYGLCHISFINLIREKFSTDPDDSMIELYNEEDLNEDLKTYLNGEGSLPEEFYTDILGRYWFKKPWMNMGFVLSGFPNRLADLEMMTKYKLIPDIVIELLPSTVEVQNEILEHIYQYWEDKFLIKREEESLMRSHYTAQREEDRQRRFQELMDERRDTRYESRKHKTTSFTDEAKESDNETKASSGVSFDSVEDQKDIDEVMQIVDQEFPDLSSEKNQTFDEAKQKFRASAAEFNRKGIEQLKAIEKKCGEECISYQKIHIELDHSDKVLINALYLTDAIKHRTNSMYERCYEVTPNEAADLLSCGYCFLSKFGRTCPVQYFDCKNPFQMYLPMSERNDVFPVIHRSYIYFLIGEKNVARFKKDPLMFVTNEFHFPLRPLNVAVTGHPKSGKTTLCNRIQKEYGMKIVSRGQAIKYVLKAMPFSELAGLAEERLRKGDELSDEIVVRCVEAACYDPLVITQGVIFDGFPNAIAETMQLSNLGLVPNLILNLKGDKKEFLESFFTSGGSRGFPRYSPTYFNILSERYGYLTKGFSRWFDREYQVRKEIQAAASKWLVWKESRNWIEKVCFKRKEYYVNAYKNCTLDLDYMLVTPLEFLERRSKFKTFCPCCLHFDGILTTGGEPPDRTTLVQYLEHFYWLCAQHIESFHLGPDHYLPPNNKHSLPKNLPSSITLRNVPPDVAEQGCCVVCYKKEHRVIDGLIAYAVSYSGRIFLFDTPSCMQSFMRKPKDFRVSIRFRPPNDYPSLDYKELPVLGMLEQYVGHQLVSSLNYFVGRRPIVPGLGVAASVLVGIGLHLKVHFSKVPEQYRKLYAEGEDLFYERRNKLVNYLDRMKSVVNPYLFYQEPMPDYVEYSTPKKSPSKLK